MVKNVSPTLVSLSWNDSIAEKECLEELEIFYWKTKLEVRRDQKVLSKDKDGTLIISVSSETQYSFQVKLKEARCPFFPFDSGSSKSWSSIITIKTLDSGKTIFSSI